MRSEKHVNMLEKHVNKLGYRCRDRVTGLEGVIVTVGFDLYGCIQAIVHPGKDKEGDLKETIWFDIERLEIISKDTVMQLPDFGSEIPSLVSRGLKGPSEKPRMKKA